MSSTPRRSSFARSPATPSGLVPADLVALRQATGQIRLRESPPAPAPLPFPQPTDDVEAHVSMRRAA